MAGRRVSLTVKTVKELRRFIKNDFVPTTLSQSATAAPTVLLFYGDVGAGKTLFVRELVRALTGDATAIVASPTYLISNVYDLDECQFFHFDLYRLSTIDKTLLDAIGLTELFQKRPLSSKPDIVAIEWAERLDNVDEQLLPKHATSIGIVDVGMVDDEFHRSITIDTT